jgi:alpha-tubulin suppressor-like RCC1 family protein
MRAPNGIESPWRHARRGVARLLVVRDEHTVRPFIMALGLFSIAACGGGGGSDSAAPQSPSPTLSIQVPPVVATNATLPATATVGNPSQSVTWSSDSPGVATISAAGAITGVSPGQSVIRAVSGTLSASHSVNVIPRFTDMGLGIRWGCGITATTELYCWGLDGEAELGEIDGVDACPLKTVTICVATPHKNRAALPFTNVNGGYQNTCGVTAAGEGYCWGGNMLCATPDPAFPRCGWLGTAPFHSAPIKISGGLHVTSVGAGSDFACMLTDAGAAYCLGVNYHGNLGATAGQPCGIAVQNYPCTDTAVAVTGGLAFTSLSVGGFQVCGLTAAGAAYCWGANDSGQLGNGISGDDVASPAAVAGGLHFASIKVVSSCFVAVNCGAHSCALTAAGQAYCWGANSYGQLGDGTTVDSRVPVAVTGSLTFKSIAVGGVHTCGLTTGGLVYCWGWNDRGTLGDGTFAERHAPTKVVGSVTFEQLEASANLTCGRTAVGSIYCWGNNAFEQIGAGLASQLDVNSPVGIGVP